MNDFDPGPGWRQVDENGYVAAAASRERLFVEQGGAGRFWVREVPVPPLPTDPGYYVDANGSAWHLDDDGEWDDTFGNPVPYADGPKRPLTRYEPRAVTAKAVLDRVNDLLDGELPWITVLARVAREYGVTS